MDKLLNSMYEKTYLKSQPISEKEQELIEFVKTKLGTDVDKYLELENIKYEIFVNHLEDAYKQGVLDALDLLKDKKRG